jgi:hypothetical protein
MTVLYCGSARASAERALFFLEGTLENLSGQRISEKKKKAKPDLPRFFSKTFFLVSAQLLQ